MGLFDNLFMAADLVKSGVAAYKASERLEELCNQANDSYDGSFTDENRRLFADFEKATKAASEATGDDQAKLSDAKDEAAIAFLLSAVANPAISKKFNKEVTDAIAEWNRTNDLPMEIFEKRMMKEAKTDEERAEIRKALDEIKADES